MFKRIRVHAGDTLQIKLPVNDMGRVVRAQITKGSGTPIARFQQYEDVFYVPAETTMRMSGTYKYEIAMTDGSVVRSVQYGILEVL
ncbi:hypothetical protein ACJW8F_13090 [Plesiomonas shigelloides]|uniref:hypothetical protein n=1 Tax=Plesiomonas shigelloides TaxID=703 RepID=UPI00387F0891